MKEVVVIDYNKLSIDILRDKDKHQNLAKIVKKSLWNKKMNLQEKFVRFKIVDNNIIQWDPKI
jgi:hypothetical protein